MKKIEDFTVNDIVAFNHNITRITSLNGKDSTIRVECSDEDINVGDKRLYTVPLDNMILMENGFLYNSEKESLYVEEGDKYFEISVYPDFLSVELCGKKIYVTDVHQLQHLLRLIGFYDLANNFVPYT